MIIDFNINGGKLIAEYKGFYIYEDDSCYYCNVEYENCIVDYDKNLKVIENEIDRLIKSYR